MTQVLNVPHLEGNLFQPWHIILVLAIVILLFGGTKIPELMKGVGKGVGEFKKGLDEGKNGTDDDDESRPKSA